jgi:hypothetical protein
MAKLDVVRIDTTTIPGRTLLRYTAILVNVGRGPLELIGTRPNTSTPEMTVVQRIRNDAGGSTDVPVGTTMYYAGDGHEHWHVKDIEGGTLIPLGGGPALTSAKHGFCFSDNVKYNVGLPGALRAPTYVGHCEPEMPLALTADMGLSLGWGDDYPWNTNLQWIDITGIPNGRYTLTVTANPGDVLQETSYANNSVSAVVKINGIKAKLTKKTRGA